MKEKDCNPVAGKTATPGSNGKSKCHVFYNVRFPGANGETYIFECGLSKEVASNRVDATLNALFEKCEKSIAAEREKVAVAAYERSEKRRKASKKWE